MSKSTFEELFDEHGAQHKVKIMADTWGHLAPMPNRKYPARMIFSQSKTGDLVVTRSTIGDLPGSPWLHKDMQDFVYKYAKEPGEVFKFVGTYIKHPNGKCQFKSKVTNIIIN